MTLQRIWRHHGCTMKQVNRRIEWEYKSEGRNCPQIMTPSNSYDFFLKNSNYKFERVKKKSTERTSVCGYKFPCLLCSLSLEIENNFVYPFWTVKSKGSHTILPKSSYVMKVLPKTYLKYKYTFQAMLYEWHLCNYQSSSTSIWKVWTLWSVRYTIQSKGMSLSKVNNSLPEYF